MHRLRKGFHLCFSPAHVAGVACTGSLDPVCPQLVWGGKRRVSECGWVYTARPPPPPNDVADTGPLGGKQCRQHQLNDLKHNKLVVAVYTGITIQTLVLYYTVKRAGFTHAHRCVHKHTQILHSADRPRQLPTLRKVSSLNTISCHCVLSRHE